MSFIKVYIHFVWSTKNREQFLDTPSLRKEIWKHIFFNGHEKGIAIDFVNGYSDHCHCLVSMNAEQTLSQITQLLKGESSFWINKNELTERKFGWQKEFYAVSVSESMLEKVRNYIKNQEEHHKEKTFEQEEQQLMRKFGFAKYE
ncbi:IS200/IS605 family transposase [Bernardetia sp. Wsw4-3y2]|uniref:IS200/IS605 family transposase n=1 Tax=Bernardetia sp. Wsw4-3y2 TaxID=3127471 RepID=UPI0030D37F01